MSRSTLTTQFRPLAVLGIAAIVFSLVTPREASAQAIISPFFGYNFGGDAGCPAITDCEDKNLNWGVSLATVGKLMGFELEFGYANDFFGKSTAYDSNVLTFTGNIMLAPRFGPVQPYGLIGLGLIKSETDQVSESLTDTSNSNFGWDTGGGLMVFFGRHVGVRGEVRYFNSFEAASILGLEGREEKLDFGRFSGGVVFRF